MKKTLNLTALLLLSAAIGQAQNVETVDTEKELKQDNAAFVFTESQMGEDDDMTQNVVQVGTNTNVYTSSVGFLWSPVRFKYRAYNSRYHDIYMNGVQVNNAENGQFNYSTVGGMNDAVRGFDLASPFESNNFSMSSIGGSSNYNFRAGHYAAGNKVTLSGANRNYTLRGMYTFGTGITSKGWAFFGSVGYRWANMNTAAVKGTFYNSASYFLAVQKIFNEHHSLNLATWGSPTERAQQGASTDEAYWLANDYQYNPYWGYQNGERRASRVVNNFEPSALLTWDYTINDNMKLTTSAFFKYVQYSSTKLNYNGTNPAPDYWKNFPSYNYDVWGRTDGSNNDFNAFWESHDYWTSDIHNRQINFDKLYFSNLQLNKAGRDAAYYIQAKHNDQMVGRLGSTFEWNIDQSAKWDIGVQMGYNKGMHYQTMVDLLGSEYFHNVNTYAIGTYPASDDRVQYDLNNPNGVVRKGDRFGYDYNIYMRDIRLWTQFTKDLGISHNFIAAKIDGTQMWREGKMRNGLCKDYSYGKSGKGSFMGGGFKMGSVLNLSHGNAIMMGVGYETRSPLAHDAFESPEMNNNFVRNLKTEKIASAELGYALNCSWLRLNVNAYFTHSYDATEWQNFYFDDVNSFTYVSLSGVEKNHYGAEIGARFKITSNFDINVLGTYAESQYASDTKVNYMLSTKGTMNEDICHNKGMRESGTPLAAASVGLNYRIKGWFFNLNGNYYDRIYLSYSPCLRYGETLKAAGNIDNEGNYIVPEQAKSNGGFMLDASIGKLLRIAKRPMSINLMLVNILNNRKLCTGGYEQSRSNYTIDQVTGDKSDRTYSFSDNPKKFYAQGFNFMLNVNYRF